MRELPELPVFSKPDPGPFDLTSWRLRVEGLVARPMALSYPEVLALLREEHTGPFECVEGWRVPENRWEGVPVCALLDRAEPLPEARFATFHAGVFAMSLPLGEARSPGIILAHRLNGAPLAPEHGAPLRLVAPGRECFYSVKWVQRVELSRETQDTGRGIALARVQTRQAEG